MESTVYRDVLLLTRVDKPAQLRRLLGSAAGAHLLNSSLETGGEVTQVNNRKP